MMFWVCLHFVVFNFVARLFTLTVTFQLSELGAVFRRMLPSLQHDPSQVLIRLFVCWLDVLVFRLVEF